MKTKDTFRKWMWLLIGIVAALQLYFVRELLAAFALFVLAFAAITSVIVTFYMLQKVWETGLSRLFISQNAWVLAIRHGLTYADEWAHRPIRRAGPEMPSNI